MMLPEYPQLRPYLGRYEDPSAPRHAYLVDRLGLVPEALRLTLREFDWLEFLNGQRGLRDIQQEIMRRNGGILVALDQCIDLVRRLEEGAFLEGPRFRRLVEDPVRPPRCIGCYAGEPELLRQQLDGLFTDPRGPGLSRPVQPNGRLRAALIPHIDYQRGGVSYAWGFKEVAEHTDASLFVIIGTAHYSTHRFTLTRKNFRTPLGILPTDQEYIDRLVKHYGEGLFDDEWMAHFPEHSIELEVVFLQYLYEGKRPVRIVPLVVGSFGDCVQSGADPAQREDIARMIGALRRAEAETAEPICYIISGDLAHIGPKFGQPAPLDAKQLRHSKDMDLALLLSAEACDMARYFRIIADEGDARNICGLPPTFTLLEAILPGHGKLLHYDRYVHPRGQESVSFASMGFYQ